MRTLLRTDSPARLSSLVLMFHGGAAHSHAPVGRRSGSVRRMRLLQRTIAQRLAAKGTAVWLLQFGLRGWNDRDPEPSPMPDARWALGEARKSLGDIPVILLGHSMGGRTAVHVADDAHVVGVVALAPWLSSEDPVGTLSGRRLLVAHGRRDRITSARQSRTYVERADAAGIDARFVDMGWRGHYMLTHVPDWNRVTLDALTSMLP